MNYALRPETAACFAGKTVLLTGSAGFLGKHFTKALEQAGAVVEGLDIITGEDVASDRYAGGRSSGRFDFILHAAGIASPFHYRAKPLQAMDACIRGVRNMLDSAKGTGTRLLFLSSSEIYGNPDKNNVPTLESYRGNVSCTGPRACYDESKRLGETLCTIYHEHFGVHAVTVRPFNGYGPGMSATDYRVLPNWREAVRKGEPLRIYGNGNQTRTFCYVTDLVRGCLEALAHGEPGPYNIGNPTPEVSMLELADRLGKVIGKRLDFVRIDHPDTYPADEPQRRCPDIRKAREHFGFEPKVSLEDGLAEFMKEET
jgi:UDP-glucuronate decarboxylase